MKPFRLGEIDSLHFTLLAFLQDFAFILILASALLARRSTKCCCWIADAFNLFVSLRVTAESSLFMDERNAAAQVLVRSKWLGLRHFGKTKIDCKSERIRSAQSLLVEIVPLILRVVQINHDNRKAGYGKLFFQSN